MIENLVADSGVIPELNEKDVGTRAVGTRHRMLVSRPGI